MAQTTKNKNTDYGMTTSNNDAAATTTDAANSKSFIMYVCLTTYGYLTAYVCLTTDVYLAAYVS